MADTQSTTNPLNQASSDANYTPGDGSDAGNGNETTTDSGRNGVRVVLDETIPAMFNKDNWDGEMDDCSGYLNSTLAELANKMAILTSLSQYLTMTPQEAGEKALGIVKSLLSTQWSATITAYNSILTTKSSVTSLANFKFDTSSFESMLTGSEGFLTLCESSVSGIKSVEDNLDKVFKSYKNVIQNFGKTVSDTWENIKNYFTDKWNKITDTWNKITNTLSNFPSSLMESLSKMTFITKGWELVKNIGLAIVMLPLLVLVIPYYLVTNITAVLNLIRILKQIISQIKNVYNTIKNAVNQIKKITDNIAKGNWVGLAALVLSAGASFISIPSSFHALYPNNLATNRNGIIEETDSTPGHPSKRVSLPAGTSIDMNEKGDIVRTVPHIDQTNVGKNKEVHVKEDYTLEVEGKISMRGKTIEMVGTDRIDINAPTVHVSGDSLSSVSTLGAINGSPVITMMSQTSASLGGITTVGIKSKLAVDIIAPVINIASNDALILGHPFSRVAGSINLLALTGIHMFATTDIITASTGVTNMTAGTDFSIEAGTDTLIVTEGFASITAGQITTGSVGGTIIMSAGPISLL